MPYNSLDKISKEAILCLTSMAYIDANIQSIIEQNKKSFNPVDTDSLGSKQTWQLFRHWKAYINKKYSKFNKTSNILSDKEIHLILFNELQKKDSKIANVTSVSDKDKQSIKKYILDIPKIEESFLQKDADSDIFIKYIKQYRNSPDYNQEECIQGMLRIYRGNILDITQSQKESEERNILLYRLKNSLISAINFLHKDLVSRTKKEGKIFQTLENFDSMEQKKALQDLYAERLQVETIFKEQKEKIQELYESKKNSSQPLKRSDIKFIDWDEVDKINTTSGAVGKRRQERKKIDLPLTKEEFERGLNIWIQDNVIRAKHQIIKDKDTLETVASLYNRSITVDKKLDIIKYDLEKLQKLISFEKNKTQSYERDEIKELKEQLAENLIISEKEYFELLNSLKSLEILYQDLQDKGNHHTVSLKKIYMKGNLSLLWERFVNDKKLLQEKINYIYDKLLIMQNTFQEIFKNDISKIEDLQKQIDKIIDQEDKVKIISKTSVDVTRNPENITKESIEEKQYLSNKTINEKLDEKESKDDPPIKYDKDKKDIGSAVDNSNQELEKKDINGEDSDKAHTDINNKKTESKYGTWYSLHPLLKFIFFLLGPFTLPALIIIKAFDNPPEKEKNTKDNSVEKDTNPKVKDIKKDSNIDQIQERQQPPTEYEKIQQVKTNRRPIIKTIPTSLHNTHMQSCYIS
jgi:hypothetical protein